MATVQTFIRRTPAAFLKSYFDFAGISFPNPIDWNGSELDVTRSVLQSLTEMDDTTRARIANDGERIGSMADDAGQTALFCVVQDQEHFKNLENGHARSISLLIDDEDSFRRAEETRYNDEHRYGRDWVGYSCESNLNVDISNEACSELEEAVRNHFNSKNAHVDIFDRVRHDIDGKNYELIQIAVYRDGMPQDMLEFSDTGDLGSRSYRPVFETAMTYEPREGVMEIVTKRTENRKVMAELFAKHIMKTDFRYEELKLRRYNLNSLLERHEFPVDPKDGIQSVDLLHLRLMSLDSSGELLTIECKTKARRTIWDIAEEKLRSRELSHEWVATRAKLLIRFSPTDKAPKGRALPLTITIPNGCNLKEHTHDEQLVGQKYLRQWGILEYHPG